MDERYKPLFTPWKVGNVEIKNRIAMMPMEGTNWIMWETRTKYNKEVEEFTRERAKADVGLFIPGAIPVISMVGNKWLYKHPEVFKPVKTFMDEIHSYGSKVFFQLTIGPGRSLPMPQQLFPLAEHKWLGKALNPVMGLEKWWLVAPDDDLPNVWATDKMHHAMTAEQIRQVVYAFGQSAKLCKEAGVDGVEIHAVHEGYLLDQFTMPYTNHRTDEYGGSLENRYRFAMDIVKEIKKVCGEDYPVSLRYSVTSKTKGFNQGAVPGEEFVEVGRTMEESEKAIKMLEEAGYDLFNCDNGTYDAWYWPHPPVYAPLNTNLKEVEYIKQFTSKPVIAAGRMQPEEAADSIKAGKIDAMGLGRQILCDGEYVKKIEEDRMDEIRPCISCHAACLPLGNTNGHGVDFDLIHIHMGRCALNPRTLDESLYPCVPAEEPKRIAVIGGGIAGMETAIQADKRGHKVDLYEKTDKLGGVFIAAAAPDFKEKDKDLLKFYEKQLKDSGVTVHMNTEVKNLISLEADEIVVATGAAPRTLRIPGSDRAITATDYLLRKKEVGDNVVIIGGGLTGCEIAYELALEGKHPVVVEQMEYLIKAKGVCGANSTMLRDLLTFHKVPSYLESGVTEIKENSVVIKTKNSVKEIPADSVITSIGYIPGNALVNETLQKENPHIHVIGDAGTVGNLMTAIKAANDFVQTLK